MGILRAIPLPLRLAAIFLLGLVLFQLAGKVPASVFIALASVFWLFASLTWAYDQGWLNPLARVSGISNVLGYFSNRASLAGPSLELRGDAVSAPPGELNSAERHELLISAKNTLASMLGNEAARAQLNLRILASAEENPRNPFGTNAPATIIFIAGPRGVGKTTLARVIANLLTGLSATKTAKIVTVRPTDLRTGEFGSAIELARSKARSARAGTLLLDDADWLLTSDPSYGTADTPGRDFGLTLVEAVSEFPREVLIVATISSEAFGRLKEDAQHLRWLGKLARRDIILEDLGDDALVKILDGELASAGWQFENQEARQAARRMLSDLRDRKAPHFDNAIACRRAAEALVDITSEEFDVKAKQKTVGRDAIRRAGEELE